MATEIRGERAQCPCQREGWITSQSEPLEVERPWWVITHEDVTHRVGRIWIGDRFQFIITSEPA